MNRGSNLDTGPRRNRVTPDGHFEAVKVRGTLMGNRGRLHDYTGRMGVMTFAQLAWITCLLDFKSRHRTINAPDSYTELFGLDEATFLAAGHRPCAECRRGAFDRFKDAWRRAHGLARPPRAAEIDAALHAARLDHYGRQRTHLEQLGILPSGVIVALPSSPDRSALLWGGMLYPWNHAGYSTPIAADLKGQVVVLTPRPAVAVLAAGYVPEVALGRPQTGVSRRGRVSGLTHAHAGL